jgi:hypothetical protein
VAKWAGQVQSTFADLGGYVPDAMLAIIQHESSGNPDIQNQAGYPAYGLFPTLGAARPQRRSAVPEGARPGDRQAEDDQRRLRPSRTEPRRPHQGARPLPRLGGAVRPGHGGAERARDIGSGEDGNAFLNGPNGIMPMYDNIVRGKQQGAGGANAGGLVQRAESLVGTPYSLGGLRGHPDQPQLGLDCSEYTAWVYQGQGVALSWNAQQQYNQTQRVDPQNLQVGDLVFFHGTNAADPDYITHVGMYIGNGRMINAQDGGVMEADLNSQYWQQHYAGAGRVQGVQFGAR